MFIDRRQLAEIIAEEVRGRLAELAEGSEEGGDDGKRKRPRKPSTADAEGSPSPKGEPPPGPGADVASDDGSDDAGPDAPEDADVGAEADADDALDADGDAGEDPSGAVNNEIAGKIVQAITIEPESKILPGAREVVITFGDSSDALRVLVTATGQVKFFWRGHLHDIP